MKAFTHLEKNTLTLIYLNQRMLRFRDSQNKISLKITMPTYNSVNFLPIWLIFIS
jgi:hypothetical protein